MAAKKPTKADAEALNTLHNHLNMLAQTRAHILSAYMPEDIQAMTSAPAVKEIDKEMTVTVRLIVALRTKLYPSDKFLASAELVPNAPAPIDKQ